MAERMMNPDLRRKIKVRMRPDLVFTQSRYGGQHYWIVKDPVSLRYYRFRDEELFLLKQFDGQRTLDDIRHLFVENFRPQRISVPELEKFVQQLLQAGIATADTPQIGQRLYERYKKRKRDKIKQTFMNIMYLKIPLFDPERLLARMMPYFGFVFSIPFFLLMIAFWTCSGLLILVNFDTFMSKLPSYEEFFTWRNLFYFWFTLAAVKIIHEFGHGISCKKFGGEVHEMGLLFLVFTPCLYCNVTDAWMLPNKWHRAIIGAAGIYVELILSAAFVWIWWYTEPGLLNTLSLSIIFISSVSTVLFNANPLLRFDGYYILADLMEVPNLREHANRYLGNTASRIFFGSECVPNPYMPKKYRGFFIFYAIAAYVYRWVITIAILYFLYTFLKPYKLGILSAMLAVGAATLMVVMPIKKITKTLRSRWKTMKVRNSHMVKSFGGALIILAVILFTPLPFWIDVPLILQPENATGVYIRTAGVLEEIYVKDGEFVQPGQKLAELKNPEMIAQHRDLLMERQLYDRLMKAYSRSEDASKKAEAKDRRESANELCRHLDSEIRNLTIRVPKGVSGRVIMPPKTSDMGKTYQTGEPFCQIGQTDKLEAYLVIDQADRNLVGPNQKVKLKLAGHVGPIIAGKIKAIATREIEELPQALSNKAGGEVATTTDQQGQGQKEIPMFRSYQIEVTVPNPDGELIAGTRGWARIDVGYRSVYWRVKRYLQQTFHFKL